MTFHQGLFCLLCLAHFLCARAEITNQVADAEPQIEVDVSMIALAIKDVESVARKQSNAAPTTAQILALWRDGKGRLVTAQKLITASGAPAQLNALEEFIYPTEFESTLPQFSGENAPIVAPAVPGSFETTGLGNLLTLTPEFRVDGHKVGLSISQERTEFVAWDDVITTSTSKFRGKDELTLKQPRIHTMKLTSSLVLRSGAPLVLGGNHSKDGKEFIYLIVTVMPIDADGTAIVRPDENRSPSRGGVTSGGAP